MKIVIITDAWEPQINGVVRTLKQTCDNLRKLNHDVALITPQLFKTVPCPSYPSIRLAVFPRRKMRKMLSEIDADAVHIATEGPLGMAARSWCLKYNMKFTTSYHTQFPEYIRLRAPVPLSWSYAWFRRFHDKAVRTLVPTESQKQHLQKRSFKHVVIWSRGVDTDIFTPDNPQQLNLPAPIMMNMGRVAIEKNIEAFLELDLPGSKVVVGDGPDLQQLRQRYPNVLFTGAKFSKELASYLSAADVFVFPSKTDTFGLVIIEAMACGVPVAAYPVTGPKDIIIEGQTGVCHNDLATATRQALDIDSAACLDYARQHSWMACTEVFAAYMYDNSVDGDKQDRAIVNQSF